MRLATPALALFLFFAVAFTTLAVDYLLLGQLASATEWRVPVFALGKKPGKDFGGGEFVLTEQRPRMQSRPEVVPLAQGEAVIFAVSQRPVQGVAQLTALGWGQRRDSAREQATEARGEQLRREHIVKRVIERSEIRIDLLAHIAGEESEPLSPRNASSVACSTSTAHGK